MHVLLTALAATLLLASGVDAQPALVQVRVVSSANDDVTPVLYALAQGWFRAAGLDIDLVASSNGSAVAAAVAGGAADIGRSNVVPTITAHARGVPFVLVAPSGTYFQGTTSSGRVIVVRDSPYKSPRDLNDQTVSVQGLSDIEVIVMRSWIDKGGGDSSTVKFVEAAGPAAGAALDTSHIAAASVVDPFLSDVMTTGKYRILGDPTGSLGPRMMVAGWFTTSDYSAKNPTVIRRFSQILARASAFCNDHPDQTVDLLSKFSHVDADTIRHSIRDKYDLVLIPSDIQPIIDAAARYKLIPQAYPARDIIDPNAAR